mgnify:CR=1 FL=1
MRVGFQGELGAFSEEAIYELVDEAEAVPCRSFDAVVLAVDDFSLEGKLLIIDHGQGLNSAFLHSSRLYVTEGEMVRQGQHIGDVGASGRATGPHLHWSLKWRNSRLDPLLFAGPMG